MLRVRPQYYLSSSSLVVEDNTQQNRWYNTQLNCECAAWESFKSHLWVLTVTKVVFIKPKNTSVSSVSGYQTILDYLVTKSLTGPTNENLNCFLFLLIFTVFVNIQHSFDVFAHLFVKCLWECFFVATKTIFFWKSIYVIFCKTTCTSIKY